MGDEVEIRVFRPELPEAHIEVPGFFVALGCWLEVIDISA